MDYMDLNVRCPGKAAELNHSLTHLWVSKMWGKLNPQTLTMNNQVCKNHNLILWYFVLSNLSSS